MKKMYDIVISIILVLGLIISAAIISNSFDKLARKTNVIVIKGHYVKILNPKSYEFSLNFYENSKELEKAYELLYEREDKIKKLISIYNFEESNIMVKANFKENTDVVIDYNLNKSLVFKSKSLNEIKKIRTNVERLLVQINNINISDIESEYNEEKANESELLVLAVEDAKKKAHEILKREGKQLGDLTKLINTSIVRKNEKITVDVTVTYQIK